MNRFFPNKFTACNDHLNVLRPGRFRAIVIVASVFLVSCGVGREWVALYAGVALTPHADGDSVFTRPGLILYDREGDGAMDDTVTVPIGEDGTIAGLLHYKIVSPIGAAWLKRPVRFVSEDLRIDTVLSVRAFPSEANATLEEDEHWILTPPTLDSVARMPLGISK